MTKPMVRIHNAETNEVIDREMTDQELVEYEFNKNNAEVVKAEEETKATQKAALLEKLGITADQAKLLLA
jgi:hypothetical protein